MHLTLACQALSLALARQACDKHLNTPPPPPPAARPGDQMTTTNDDGSSWLANCRSWQGYLCLPHISSCSRQALTCPWAAHLASPSGNLCRSRLCPHCKHLPRTVTCSTRQPCRRACRALHPSPKPQPSLKQRPFLKLLLQCQLAQVHRVPRNAAGLPAARTGRSHPPLPLLLHLVCPPPPPPPPSMSSTC